MKQVIKSLLQEQLENIYECLDKTSKSPGAGNIHAVRLEIKRLKSFLEMITVNGQCARLPKKIKKVFKYLGKIRLIQLQRENVMKSCKQYQIHIPDIYLSTLKTDLKILKKEAKTHLRKSKPVNERKLLKGLPRRLTERTVCNYFHHQEESLNVLLHQQNPDEVSIHNMRKVIKGMLYSLTYVKGKYSRSRLMNHGRVEKLKLLESEIGEFHDLSYAIRLLPMAQNLKTIRDQWQKDKVELAVQINGLKRKMSFINTETGFQSRLLSL